MIKFFQILHWLFLDGRHKAVMRMLAHRKEREEKHLREERFKQ